MIFSNRDLLRALICATDASLDPEHDCQDLFEAGLIRLERDFTDEYLTVLTDRGRAAIRAAAQRAGEGEGYRQRRDDAIYAATTKAHEENRGGGHEAGFCSACADFYAIVCHAFAEFGAFGSHVSRRVGEPVTPDEVGDQELTPEGCTVEEAAILAAASPVEARAAADTFDYWTFAEGWLCGREYEVERQRKDSAAERERTRRQGAGK